MVSRVYTPLITPYQRNQNAAGTLRGPVPDPSEESGQSAGKPTSLIASANNDLSRPASSLQAVQYNQFQKIPLSAVVHDFKNTMGALGVDETTQSEVAAYLNVVKLQAGKDQPEVGFIKQTLRTAANSLDQYIGKALGQPSKVVKEWVDALLMQDIDYKADLSAESPDQLDAAKASPVPDNTSESTTHAVVEANPADLQTSAKSQLKTLIQEAKVQAQQKNFEQADQKLQSALDLLADKNKPEWEGKVWNLRGRVYDQSGQWEKSVSAFDEAANHFEQGNSPQKQANALQAAASVLEDHGEFQKAKGYYQRVVALDEQQGNPVSLIRSYNDLGSIALRTGDTSQSIQALQKAAGLMNQQAVPPTDRSDIMGNLAAAYRKNQDYPQAIETYRQSLSAAKEARDKTRYASGLQQLAAVYVEANQPDSAMKILQRLQNLG